MRKRAVLFAMLMCITSGIAVGQQVSVNFNHDQSFAHSPHLRMGLQQCQPDSKLDTGANSEQDIDSALQAKGLQLVQESQNPDLIVTANGGMKQQTSYSVWGCAESAEEWAEFLRSRMS